MKKVVKIFSVLMIMLGSFAFGQIMNNNAKELLESVPTNKNNVIVLENVQFE